MAAMILRCAGQIRIHTFTAMIVPNSVPTWIAHARGTKHAVEHEDEHRDAGPTETATPAVSFFASAFHRSRR